MAGKEFNYISEPNDKLKCSICLDVATDPKQHEACGKIFCAECIEKCGDKPCPSCRGESPNFFKDTRAAQEIRDLRLRCNNFDSGCNWRGTARTHNKHLTICEFEYVSCKYQYVGCNMKMMRKDISEHEEKDDKKHLHLALNFIAKPTLTLNDGESFVFKMTEYSSKKQKKEAFSSDPFYVHPNGYKMYFKIYANGTGSGEGTHLSVSLQFLEGPFDNSLEWPFSGDINLSILNQLSHYDHFDVDVWHGNEDEDDYAYPGNSVDIERFISHSQVEMVQDKVQLLKDDSLHFKISVEFNNRMSWLTCGRKIPDKLENMSKFYIDKEPFVFKLHRYKSMKEGGEVWVPQPFFTSPCGYRMVVEVFANGYGSGTGTHISVCVCILEGPYNKSLSWPFVGRLKVELLNQLSDEHHYSQDMVFSNHSDMQEGSNWVIEKFLKNTRLHVGDKQFLMNDSLYFRISVTVDNHKPWLTCTQ